MSNNNTTKYWIIAIVAILVFTGALMAIIPPYMVWSAEKRGQAEFVQAEQNKRIAIEIARATKESAEFLAEAEVIRARGVAEANQIIGNSLQGNNEYIMYLWVQTLANSEHQLIYIPTEGQLPVTEAIRLRR